MAVKGMVGTYVPSELTIVISQQKANVSFVVTGFSPDSVVSIERQDPTWESTEGADGWHQRTHRLSKTFRATVSLMQISPSNDYFSGLVAYDEQDLRGGGLFTCTITDKSGRSYAYSDQAYVIEPTTEEFSQSASNRDWVLVLPYAEHYIGGNSQLPQEVVDKLALLGIVIDESWIKG